MKKLVSVLLVIVLLMSALPLGASAVCNTHTYTNACDKTCNACGAARTVKSHTYTECFNGYSTNLFGAWIISVTRTGIYSLRPASNYNAEYNVHDIAVLDKQGNEVHYNESKGGFPLVADLDYTIKFRYNCEENISDIIKWATPRKSSTVFTDASANQWYSDALVYAVGRGIISGYGGTTKFGTADNIQRQDFLVILSRLDGVDLTKYGNKKSSFADVTEGSYYEAAVNWGAENGIVTGYNNNSFGTGDKITREQLVTFLYRYADYKGLNTSYTTIQKNKVKNTYADYTKVTGYAQDAVIWAVTNGVINGRTSTTIVPGGNAQRCEAAQIMLNIFKNNIIPTCEHRFADAICLMPQICQLCGVSRGSPKGHSYLDATCTEPITCDKCGKTRGNALGHTYIAGECININRDEPCGDYNPDYCPKLYFTGDMSKITDPKQTSKNIECDIDFEYRSRGQIVNGAAKIKIQGTSSTQYAKKNYTINFYEDSTYGSKKKINVGWGAQSKYCLKANWIDKTHSRNVVTAKLGAQMQAKYGLFNVAPHNGTVDGFPVEIYINGEFHGLYTMNIPKDEWMFGMDKNNPNHIVICGENWNDPVKFKAIPQDLKDWAVEAGPEDDATLQKVQRLVKFVKDSSDAEFKANFSQYLDLDSTINYYIMMNCAWLPDNSGKNMLLATYDGKVWYPTLYDLDTSWGTHWRGDSLYNYSSGFQNGGDSVLWQRVRTLYKKEIAARYFELRQSVLSKENIMAEFNNFKASIPKEVLDRETAKWNTAEHPIPGYDISQIEEYINTVFPRLDAEFNKWK